MTSSSGDPWLTDHSDQAPPRKSAASHPGQQAPHKCQPLSQHRRLPPAKSRSPVFTRIVFAQRLFPR
jgi:hypothetical protein